MYLWLCVMSCVWLQSLVACTAFRLEAEDGAAVYCRSMEFAYEMNSDIVIVPRGSVFKCSYDAKDTGMSYKTLYGFVGLNQSLAPSCVNDGMNEKGLVVGSLYLPGVAQYPKLDKLKKSKTLAPWELANYLLGTCSSLDEVKGKLKTLAVASIAVPGYKDFVVPLHFWVSDSSGASVVIEYIDSKLEIHDNPVGVMTNSPSFLWHLTNLTNYCKLHPENAQSIALGQMNLKPYGQGSGMGGLPGDYTSVSRFVKAAFFRQFAKKPSTALSAVQTGFHILNTFDIFDGIVIEKQEEGHPPLAERTQWVVVHDAKNLVTYVRSYEAQKIQKLDLKSCDFNQSAIKTISFEKSFNAEAL